MNIIAWLLSLSLLIILMVEAVAFHRATVCRQKAWLKSTELLTRSKLTNAPEKDWDGDLHCKLLIKREKEIITWRRLPFSQEINFPIFLKGSL